MLIGQFNSEANVLALFRKARKDRGRKRKRKISLLGRTQLGRQVRSVALGGVVLGGSIAMQEMNHRKNMNALKSQQQAFRDSHNRLRKDLGL